MGDSTYHFQIGEFDCWAISDGTAQYSARAFFANARPQMLRRVLHEHGIETTRIATPLNCLLVRAGKVTVLVDTGMGPHGQPGTGKLLANLQAAGVTCDAVDRVILSHAHNDHIDGVLNAAGQPAFPRARYVLAQAEWDFWQSEASDERSWQVLQAIRPQLDLIPAGTTLLPGLETIPAPGHLPGHMAVKLTSNGQSLLYVGDTIAHPIHLEHPEWNIVSDLDRDLTIRTRRDLLGMAAREHMLVFVYHFPFPGLCRLAPQGDHFIDTRQL
jgi:glyoxylase-like metal-dependent hydrolase (beta-lactamase superfamily II)